MKLLENIRKHYEVITSSLILALIAIIVGFFSGITPWIDDDIMYQFNCRWSEFCVWVPIQSVKDVFESQNYHYFYTNGRYVAHWIVQLFDGVLGQTIFAIINALVYILFIRMIMLTCGVKFSNWKGVLTITCLVITCQCLRMTPAFQMYLWMYLIVLVYVYLLLHYATKNPWIIALLCVFSVIAGNSHESLTPGVSVGMALYFAVNFRKITLQQWLMGGFFCLGLLLLLFSPATRNRMVYTCSTLEYRVLALYSLRTSIPAFFILVAVLSYKTLIKRVSLREIIKSDLIWWGIWASSFAILIYWGFSGGRCVLGEELAAIILIVKMLKRGSFTPFWLWLLSVATLLFLYVQYSKVERTINYMEQIRLQALSSPDGNIYIDFTYSTPIAGLEEYSGRVKNVNVAGDEVEARYNSAFNQVYMKKWGIKHRLRFYPTALRPYIEGKADTTDGNLITMFSPGLYLFVKNKKHPATFYATYRRDIPFFKKEFPPQELNIATGIYEDENWQATILPVGHYHPAYPATFSMKRPKE